MFVDDPGYDGQAHHRRPGSEFGYDGEHSESPRANRCRVLIVEGAKLARARCETRSHFVEALPEPGTGHAVDERRQPSLEYELGVVELGPLRLKDHRVVHPMA